MAWEALNDLYREVILDHYKSPRHHEKIEPHDVEQEGLNPLCGDQLTLQLKINSGKIENVGCWGKGCSISQASASILTECIYGKALEEVLSEASFFKEVMQGKSKIEEKDVGDLEALSGVQKFPVRIKCALLAWTTLEEALRFYEKTHVSSLK